jgi:hypothetical protein
MQTYKKFVYVLFLTLFIGIAAVSARAATVAGEPAPLVIAQATAPVGGTTPEHHHRKRWFALAGVVIVVVVAVAFIARRRKPGGSAVKRIG